ncbi:MAG: sensor histidine kinase [Calditrichaeota bacterium]|nr:MAG: sensor histidine kinase [Calditrichota bacterium]
MKDLYWYKGKFKAFLFVLAVMITLGVLYYTQELVQELQKQSREYLQFKISIFEQNINREDEIGDLSFFFTNVIQTADYPSIYTDANHVPQFWRNLDIPQARQPISPDTLALLRERLEELSQINPPIPISYKGRVLGYYYYGESRIIRRLRWLPVIELIVVGMFILIGYVGFSAIKRDEEGRVWVGLAKETAHQLGTPVSSLVGWLEYLKDSPRQLEKVLPEVEKDLQRLRVIANRFSKIGSRPDKRPENLVDIIQETLQYFRKRLPQKNGKTELRLEAPSNPLVASLNRDLFSWVLENLIKNALDALGDKGGTITIHAGHLDRKHVFIDVEDTGKGISNHDRKNIFEPGFTTKKRGWGLGLNLARRIVEQYHGGRLLLKESRVDVGSVFRIILKRGEE